MTFTEGISSITITGFVFGFILFLIPNISEWLLEKVVDINDCIKAFARM